MSITIRIGRCCPSSCAVGVDAAPPQGALLRTSGPVFCPALPSPPQLSPWEPPIVDQNWVAHHPSRRRRCTSTGSPAQNIRPSFCPALPSPQQLSPWEPPIVDQNWLAHHPVRSASTLHLHREPCSEHQAQFLPSPTLPLTVEPPIVDQNWVAHHPVRSDREPCSEHQAQFLPALPSPPHGNPLLSMELGCPSSCAVGVDAAPPQGALLTTSGPVFALPYPPPHRALGNPLLSIRIGNIRPSPFRTCPTLPPTSFCPALPSPPQLSPREPPIVDQNWVAHHPVWLATPPQGALLRTSGPVFGLPYPPPHWEPPIVDHNWVAHHPVRSASTLHLHREPCSEHQAQFLPCPTLPPTVEPLGTPYCRSELGCPSSCAVGVDAAPPQGALLRTSGPVFALPYPPPHS